MVALQISPACMDWVDRPKNYKGLSGILQLLLGSHFFLTTTTTLLDEIIIDNRWPTPQIARKKKLIEAGQAKYKNTPIKDKLTQQQLV